MRQLLLPERTALPGDDEIEAALAAHHALFGGDEHAATLRAQREEALRWLRALAEFEPMLVGGVAAGWATEHSDIRIELVADDSKAVELALINREHRLSRRAGQSRSARRRELCIDTRRGGVRLIVRTPRGARQRPRRDAARLDEASRLRRASRRRGGARPTSRASSAADLSPATPRRRARST